MAYGLNINLEAETAIKVIEFLQTGLPVTKQIIKMPLLAIVGGLMRLPLVRIVVGKNSNVCNHENWKYITSPIERKTAVNIGNLNINFDGNDTFMAQNGIGNDDEKLVQYPLKFSIKTLLPWVHQYLFRQCELDSNKRNPCTWFTWRIGLISLW